MLAAQRAREFTLGWFARPIFQGDYPAVMRERVGSRLPRFTREQREVLKGSADFLGLNHYTTHLCEQPAWHKEPSGRRDARGSLAKLVAAMGRVESAGELSSAAEGGAEGAGGKGASPSRCGVSLSAAPVRAGRCF